MVWSSIHCADSELRWSLDVGEGQSRGASGNADGVRDAAKRRLSQLCSLRIVKEWLMMIETVAVLHSP